jgi:D-xylose transport system substrate-binding protein
LRKSLSMMVAAIMLLLGGVAACGSTNSGREKTPKIGVILPDTKSSARWESQDRKYLQEAFDSAGIKYDIQNAMGDKAAFKAIADQMLGSGVTVLMIVNLDSGTGKAVIDKARAQNVSVIDYDRLTTNGGASFYVSFDNIAVGRLQGEGLVKCLTAQGTKNPVVAELNGSPTDNNAALFKQGYDSVLQPKYDSRTYTKGPDQSVPDWDNRVGGDMFTTMLSQAGKNIDGVLAANDGLANAVISVLGHNGLNGKVPVTGQDATVQGLQNILRGDQCMTVYKAVKQEATAAALLAVSLATGQTIKVGQSVKDPGSGDEVRAQLLTPQAITKENIKTVVDDGYVTSAEICTAAFTEACRKAGI